MIDTVFYVALIVILAIISIFSGEGISKHGVYLSETKCNREGHDWASVGAYNSVTNMMVHSRQKCLHCYVENDAEDGSLFVWDIHEVEWSV